MPTDSISNPIIVEPLDIASLADSVTIVTDLDSALAAPAVDFVEPVEAVEELPPAPPAWLSGMPGDVRPVNIGDNSGVLAIIAGMFLLMLLSYRQCSRLFKALAGELWGMRRRANVFDEHTTNETRTIGLLVLQWSVYTGLLLYSATNHVNPLSPRSAFVHLGLIIGLMALYYIFQFCAYWTVGFTFATEEGRRHYVQGFTASQTILGVFLTIPALVAIFYPEASVAMVWIGIGLYGLARMIFIAKGFRIFYHKIWSLLYFILYLCTLEIIPLIIVYRLALFLVNSHP